MHQVRLLPHVMSVVKSPAYLVPCNQASHMIGGDALYMSIGARASSSARRGT